MKAAFAVLAMAVASTLGGCASDGSNTMFSQGFWHRDPNAVATNDQLIRNDKRPITQYENADVDHVAVGYDNTGVYTTRDAYGNVVTGDGRVVSGAGTSRVTDGRVVASNGTVGTSDGRVVASNDRVVATDNRTTYDVNGPSRPSGQPNDATSGRVMNDTQLQSGNDKTRIAAALNAQDQQFILDAGGGGLYEVQAGQKALLKSSDANVKMIAQHMVDDHTKANNALTALAQRKGVPASSLVPNADQVGMLAKLDSLNGADFDHEYINQQKKAHEDTIAKFQAEANNGFDRDVRDFASATLPTLRGHLDMINGANNIGTER